MAVAFGALVLSGCSTDVYLPPARILPLESVAMLPNGDTGVQVEGGWHNAVLFGPDALSGTLRVRHGFGGETDASAEVSVLHIEGGATSASYPNTTILPSYAYPNLVTARGGLKRRLTSWFSITAGLGGGASAGGGLLSPDVGAIAAWENPYFIPFVSARAGFSAPLAARPVEVGQSGPPQAPPFTWMGGFTLGFRVPIPIPWCKPQLVERGLSHLGEPLLYREACAPVRGSLLAGIGFTCFDYPGGQNSPQWWESVAAGGELVF